MRAVRLTRACWMNDRVHGDVNAPLDLDDEEARVVVEDWHNAVYDPVRQAELDGAPSPVPGPQAEAMQLLVDLTEELDLYGEPAPEAVPWEEALSAGRGDYGDEPELKKPWTIAPKADWIAWALNGDHGQPRPTSEEAAQMTKAQLMNRYGERL